MHLLDSPTQDGGQWDMFVSVVKKYGIVPKSAFHESKHSSNSSEMNSLINYKLRECACKIWACGDIQSAICIIKNEMKNIYKILLLCLGTPPTSFNWEYSVKNKVKVYNGLNSINFYNDFVKPLCDLDNFVSIIHDPRSFNKYNTTYTVKYLGAVTDDPKLIKYLNLDIDRIKELVKKSILDNNSVWFGCDVGKNCCKSLAILDNDINNSQDVFSISTMSMTKEQKIIWNISKMSHAMLITGVHLYENNIIRWEVENSWGKSEPANGYLLMTDKWFSDYVYQVVINKKYLSGNELKNYGQTPIVLPPWDAFGSLAS